MDEITYDIITIGGGIGGAALAQSMAERGFRVLVLEAETGFRDRVRGEIMPSWGVAEAQKLGVYETMKAAGAWEVEWEERKLKWTKGQEAELGVGRRHLPSTTVPGTAKLDFYHPDMQDALLEAAARAGAVVHRGARVHRLEVGDSPKVYARIEGGERVFTPRLVVGADGRTSNVRTWGGFEVQKDTALTYCTGVLMDDMSAPDDKTHHFRDLDQGLTALLFPQGKGRVRTYLMCPTSWGQRLSGEEDVQRLVELSVEAGVPAEYYAEAKLAGPLATFDSDPNWVNHPYRGRVALIGDAAGATDPIWGQGVSLTLRDVRELRDQLINHDDWEFAGHAYATEHDRYFTVSRTVQSWFDRLFIETGPEADALRTQAFPSWREDRSRIIDILASGPEEAIDESRRRRLYGED